jgi:protein-arginine kinase activator protein McsA
VFKRLSTEEFIENSIEIHGDIYDYSMVNYIDNNTKIEITCKICGNTFLRTPHYHLKKNVKNGCKKCYSNSQKLTNKAFIEKAVRIHGDKYNYNMVSYEKTNKKVKIICPIHGVFEQLPNSHLSGHGCRKCITNTKEFIDKSKKIHGNKYDYSLVEYVNNKDKIIIICKKHGTFEQSPKEHISGCGCSKCGITTEEFLNKCDKIHGNKYDYSLVEYVKAKEKIKIICKKHGIFNQLATNHLNGRGCPFCKESKGEAKIKNLLTSKNINYERQYVFDDCRGNKNSVLYFDFFLKDYNLCIEYDGIQHYEPIEFFGGINGFNETIRRDSIKTKYCSDNQIELIRIKHTDNVENILSTILIT